jgi:putative hydrolase of the HAD superfamily
MKKPDPRIYLLATEQLAVRPEECMYVADGVGRELEAAAEVGMQPVLIRASHDDMPDLPRVEPEKWDGPRISSLTEVLTLLE